MSCEGYDSALALHVEGDLPAAETAEMEEHLQRCARCRKLLARLEATQRTVRSLGDEPLDESVLSQVRSRVVEAVSRGAVPELAATYRWAWTLAAAVVLLVVGIVLLRFALPVPPSAVVRTAASTVETLAPPAPEPTSKPATSGSESTVPASGAVSAGVERRTVARRFALSPDDADQLARAVVAVSRVRQLAEPTDAAESVTSRPSDVVRLETADPSVVIYWQLDSSGG